MGIVLHSLFNVEHMLHLVYATCIGLFLLFFDGHVVDKLRFL